MLLITGGTEVAHDGHDRSKIFPSLEQAPFFAPNNRFYARPQHRRRYPQPHTRPSYASPCTCLNGGIFGASVTASSL